MADGFGYGGFSGVPYPFWLSSQSPHPPASAPPFLSSHPVESSDLIQGVFDPMMYHGSHQRSQPDWSNNPSFCENSRSQTPSSSFYVHNNQLGNYGTRGEDYKDMLSPSDFATRGEDYKDRLSPSGFYSSRESSSDFVSLPAENFSERQRLNFMPTYNPTTLPPVASYAEMVIRNSQEPFFTPITSSGVYASSNALDEQRPGYYFPGSDGPEPMNVVPDSHVEPYVCVTDSNPSLPMPNLKTQALFDGSQTGIHVGDGRSFPSNSDVCSHAPENFLGAQSSLHGSSIEPVNFDVLLGYGEATGHVKPLLENPNTNLLPSNIKSSGSLFKDKLEGSGVSSLYQRPYTLVADSENDVSKNSLRNAIEDLNYDEPIFWNHFTVASEGRSAPTMFSVGSESHGAMKADNENTESAVDYKPPFEGSTNQPSEDFQANQKPCKLQEQIFDIMNRDKKTTLLTDMGIKGSIRSNADDVSTGRSPERHLCDQGDFPSSSSSPRVSSVVNAMHNLSEVLVYECFNNGNWLKLEQLENLDKVVDNLTKCLKKITSNKTIAGEASLPTQAMHVLCPNVVNLNEVPKVDAKDFQGFNVKPQLDSFGIKEPVDKYEMTQSIKNILASNFPDGEETHPQTLLYKNLWLETEAALCSTTCMARYHRIKNEIGNLKLHDGEISADASTSMQEPSLNPQKSVPIINNAEQETTESLIKHGTNCGNHVVTMSHDAPQSSRFNSDSVDAVLSLMSRSFTDGLEQTIHGSLRPDAAISGKIPDAIQQESPASTTEDKHNDVIDRFQILKHQETRRKLKSQDYPDSEIEVIDRFKILKQRETNRKLKSQNFPEIKFGDHEESPEALEMVNIGRSNNVSDVMDRFQILKRREAEQVQKSLNSLDRDSDSESDNDQPSNKTQVRDHLWSASKIRNSQIETRAVDTEPSASGKGYESPTSDWEHVLKDD